MPGLRAFVLILLLSGCRPACFQFDTNRNCAVIDFGRA